MAVVATQRRVYPGLDQAVLRGVVVIGAMVSLIAAQAAGARPAFWGLAALTALAFVLALRPESVAGVLLLSGLAYVWSMANDPISPLVLLAAAGMIVVHLAAVVAAQGPATMSVDRAQVRRWAVRGVLLWLAAALVWGLDLLAAGLPGGRLVYASGLTLLVLVAAAATWVIGARR